MLGFVAYHLAEKYVYQHAPRDKVVKDIEIEHSVALFFYHFVIGIVLIALIRDSLFAGLLFFIPVALHVVIDALPHSHAYRKWYIKLIFASATFFGALLAAFVSLPVVVNFALIGLVAGLLLFLELREVIPRGIVLNGSAYVWGIDYFELVYIMWIHNINPVLVSIGPLEIRWYGVVFLLGILLGLLALNYYRKEGKVELSKDELYDLIFWLTVGIVVGARLFEIVFFNLGYYMENPARVIAVWQGGLSFHGGLVGGFVAVYSFCKRKKINFWKIADVLSIPAVLGLAFGRIANFINGELWGTVSNIRWCVVFPGGGEECRHPWQIYASLKRFFVFGVLVWLSRERWQAGFVFWNFVLLDGLGRFVLDFLREGTHYFSLTMGQWLSIAMVGIALYFLKKNHKEDIRNLIGRNP